MLRSLVLGSHYRETKRMLEQTEFLPVEVLIRNQSLRLSTLMEHAVAHVPFYRSVPLESPGNLQISDFPVIDKHLIRERLEDFLTGPGFRRRKATSGGSTGQPFLFYMDRFITRHVEKAFIFDQWKRVGYRFGDPIFNLRGRTPAPGRFVHHDRLFNIYFASSFTLARETIGAYVSAINTIRPRFMHGYPSTMYQLASLVEVSGQKLHAAPVAVFCGSEKLFAYQRAKIEAVFGCRVYHWYGHSECLALGGGCEYSDTLHLYPQYGYTELIPSGIHDELGRELHEIVATGFNNPVMPLIRYRTGDYAVPAVSQTCRCGRNYLLIDEVVGRQQEFIVDATGALISATSLIFGQHYAAFNGLDSIKLHQQRPGEIDVIVVKGSGFREDEFNRMQEQMHELIGGRFIIRYLFADQADTTAIGKARLVEQELDTRQYL